MIDIGQSDTSTHNFDEIAESAYDESIPTHVMGHLTARRAAVIRQAHLHGRILDVGCGTGRLLSQLSSTNYVRYGIDVSRGMIQQALRRDPELQCIQASATSIPYPDNSFDVVFCAAVLHHLALPSAVQLAITEMLRVTKPGGTAIIWDHNPRNPYWPIIMARVPQDIGEERLIPQSEIRAVLDNLRTTYQFKVRWRQMTFIPDFVPMWSMSFLPIVEQVLEQMPLVNQVSAHNVAIVHKQ